MRRQIHLLAPDAEWVFEMAVDAGPALEIAVVAPTGGALPKVLQLTVFARPPAGSGTPGLEAITWAFADEHGRARVPGVPPGPVAIEVRNPADGTVAAAHGVQDALGSRIEVPWVARSHVFRVLEEEGRPVSEADVFLLPATEGSTWNHAAATDDAGQVVVRGLPYDEVLVGARHPELGMLPGRRVTLSKEVGATVLRFGAQGELDVLLLEGGVPSPGTQVSLFTGGFRFVVGDLASDGGGRVRWPRLAEGLYDLRVVHPGFWPDHARVPATAGGETVELAIFRRGSIELRLVGAAGAALAGQAFELEHVELGEGSADWLAAGLIGPGASATVSDAQGRVSLEGWPRGTYRWTAEQLDGPAASGEFELQPGANLPIELRVP